VATVVSHILELGHEVGDTSECEVETEETETRSPSTMENEPLKTTRAGKKRTGLYFQFQDS
jgi:hypothetical protein